MRYEPTLAPFQFPDVRTAVTGAVALPLQGGLGRGQPRPRPGEFGTASLELDSPHFIAGCAREARRAFRQGFDRAGDRPQARHRTGFCA